MPTLMSGDAPMGGSQAKYAQVAQDEGAKPLEVEAPSGPLGSGAPPVMRKPAFWAAVLVVALGASVMLSGSRKPTTSHLGNAGDRRARHDVLDTYSTRYGR